MKKEEMPTAGDVGPKYKQMTRPDITGAPDRCPLSERKSK